MKKIYNKLVRDKFVEIYDNDIKLGVSMNSYESRYLTNLEFQQALKDKLKEEVEEALRAYDDEDSAHLEEEFADIIEVILGILHQRNSSLEEVLTIAEAKRNQKGGFTTGLYLESIDYKDK